jgi:flagellar motor switch protein FliM
MSAEVTQSQALPSSQRYELWRPVIRAERRATLERVHQELAAAWSRLLNENLGESAPVTFEGIGLEDFRQLSEGSSAALIAFFEIEDASVAGMLTIGADLARHMIEARFGAAAKDESAAAQGATFSRLEMGILRQGLEQMAEQLGEIYSRASIGRVRVTRICEHLADFPLFSPDDCLIVFRFRLGEQEGKLRFSIAANADLMNLVKEHMPARTARRSGKLARICAEIPVDVRVMLGAWNVPLRELVNLKRGDSIVLPDGADAWLDAFGRRVASVKVEIEGRRLTVMAVEGTSANGDR